LEAITVAQRGDVMVGKGEARFVATAIGTAHRDRIAVGCGGIELQIVRLRWAEAPVGTAGEGGSDQQRKERTAKIDDKAWDVHADATPMQLQQI
jgi:hypothetical protein